MKDDKNTQRAPQAKGYSEAGASVTRRALRGFIPASGAPSEDINRNNSILRQRARMLYMASPVATSAINTNRTKVIGTGLALRSTVDCDMLGMTPDAVKDWQHNTEAEFSLWAKKQNCDALGLNTFESLQQLVMKSWLLSGDVFVLIKHGSATPLNPYGLRLHIIEADRVSTPAPFCGGAVLGGVTEGRVPEGHPGAGHKIYDGVEVDESGRVAAYYISSIYPGQLSAEKQEWTRVAAYGERTGLPNILHIMDAERPDQYRGVPYLSPVIEPLLQLRRYTESELMAALVQSFFTAWIETATDPSETPFNEVGAGDIAGASMQDGGLGASAANISNDGNEYEMGPGTVTHLAPGEKVQFGNPNIPTSGFESFVKTLCRLVGSALELPYDVLVKEFNSSYSASRGALLEAWEAFKMRRRWFADDFCQPVYELFLSEAVALGRINAPGFFSDPLIREAWCRAKWIGPIQGQLDPLKEAKASVLLTDHAIKSHDQVTREMGGGDWEANVEQLKRENELLRDAGGGCVATLADGAEKIDQGSEEN